MGFGQLSFQFFDVSSQREGLRVSPPPEDWIAPAWLPPGVSGVKVVRNPRAKRYRIVVGEDGAIRLTIPSRGSRAKGIEFLESQRLWLVRAIQRIGQRKRRTIQPLRPGSRVLIDGIDVPISVNHDAWDRRLIIQDRTIPLRGAVEGLDLREHVALLLRLRAEEDLPARVAELAAHHNVDFSRVSIRDQKTRWGSCSANGTISLNWRLVQMPPDVRDYIIVHELMHRRVMDHSPRYWREVRKAFPAYETAERWLKDNRHRML